MNNYFTVLCHVEGYTRCFFVMYQKFVFKKKRVVMVRMAGIKIYIFGARRCQSIRDIANIRTYIKCHIEWHFMVLTIVSKVIPTIKKRFVN